MEPQTHLCYEHSCVMSTAKTMLWTHLCYALSFAVLTNYHPTWGCECPNKVFIWYLMTSAEAHILHPFLTLLNSSYTTILLSNIVPVKYCRYILDQYSVGIKRTLRPSNIWSKDLYAKSAFGPNRRPIDELNPLPISSSLWPDHKYVGSLFVCQK